MSTLYVDNDHVIRLKGLTDQNGEPVTAATVQAVVTDIEGEEIHDPVDLEHDSDGDYSGVLQAQNLENRSRYILQVTANHDGVKATWRRVVEAVERSR